MTGDVKIHLKSVQQTDDTAEINHTDTEGRLTVSSDRRFLLRFDTTDENGVSQTTVKSKDGTHITVVRKGIAQTEMSFDPDSPTPFMYRTPVGALGFMLETDEINLIMDEAPSLSLIMNYRLFNNGDCVSKNRIEITAV